LLRGDIAVVTSPKQGTSTSSFNVATSPDVSVPTATQKLGLSAPTVRASIEALEKAGILRELSGKRRDRVFGYRRYPDLMGRSDTKT
jgi:hypothetical protein